MVLPFLKRLLNFLLSYATCMQKKSQPLLGLTKSLHVQGKTKCKGWEETLNKKSNLRGLGYDFGQILFYFLFTVFVMLSKCIFFINQK